ncbi:MAG: AIR synthase-related protein, partial [Croceibacterium sp.]
QIVGCLNGMADACRALDYPIVSGNVSLYNESKATGGGSAILPTPAIGGVGLVQDYTKTATIAFKGDGQDIVVLGHNYDHIGQSTWLREIHGLEAGDPPPVDLELERRMGELVRGLIADGTVTAVHDVSDGGLLVAIAEMALAGGIGAELDPMTGALCFGEAQSRYVVTLPDSSVLQGRDIPMMHAGTTGGDALVINGTTVKLAELRSANQAFFKDWMEA